MLYTGPKKVVVQFVKELLRISNIDSLSITITKREKSADFSVSIATDTSSEDIVKTLAQTYSRLRTSTSSETTPAG